MTSKNQITFEEDSTVKNSSYKSAIMKERPVKNPEKKIVKSINFIPNKFKANPKAINKTPNIIL